MRRWHGNPWAVLATLCVGFFMTLLDTTIVNIAIPQMTDGLDASFDQVLWVVNAYTLVFAVLLLVGGRLGDMFGQRRMFLVGLAVFIVASALCGLAQNPGEIITTRALQGLGAAALMPQTLAIITATFPAERRGAAFGIWSAVAGAATVAGPTVGGVLVTSLSWRWIFYINVPLGILTIALATVIIPDLRHTARPRLDVPGVLLSTAGLFLVVFGLIEGQRYDWGTVWSFVSIPLVIGAGVVLLGAFLLLSRARQARGALLPFPLFRDRNYSVLSAVSVVILFASMGVLLPLTIYLQSVLGVSALTSGLILAPASLVSLFVAPVAGQLVDRVDGRYVLVPGLVVYAAGVAIIAASSHAGASRWALIPGLLVFGLGMGLVFAPTATMAMNGVPPRLAGAASGVLNTFRQLGTVAGSAAVGALLQNRLAHTLVDEAGRRSAALPAPVRGQFVQGFAHAASSGLRVGTGQSGARVTVPPGTPPGVAGQVRDAATQVFAHGFVSAMRPSLLLAVAVLAAGALVSTLARGRSAAAAARPSPSPAPAGPETTEPSMADPGQGGR